jgi:2-amino-4-hydroxy-6-hydroxymethyldihydropteridine diphosphokinase
VTVRIAVALGSNLGDRKAHLERAGQELEQRIGDVVASSSLWETAPVGGPEQGTYLNAVVVMDTDLAPRTVLDELLAIERLHGRERRERWGPRTLDLDLLLYGDRVVDSPGLTIPHPRLTERRFVLEPLLEAWPEARLPDGTVLAGCLPAVADQDVTRIGGPSRPTSGAVVFFTVATLVLAMWWLLDLVLK